LKILPYPFAGWQYPFSKKFMPKSSLHANRWICFPPRGAYYEKLQKKPVQSSLPNLAKAAAFLGQSFFVFADDPDSRRV
jgi:hypothetical protein